MDEFSVSGMNTNDESDEQVSEMAAQLTPGRERVVLAEWAGGIPQEMATLPQLRLGKRWFSSNQLLLIAVVAGAVFFGGGIAG